MEFALGLFAGLGLWWVVVVLLFIAAFCHSDDYGYSNSMLIWLAIAGVVSGFFFWMGKGPEVNFSWAGAFKFAGSYLALGVTWATFKWVNAMFRIKREVEEKTPGYQAFLSKGETETSYPFFRYLINYCPTLEKYNCWEDAKRRGSYVPVLSYSRNWVRATDWISLWPLSMIDYFFNKFLREVWDWMLRRLESLYNYLAKAILE